MTTRCPRYRPVSLGGNRTPYKSLCLRGRMQRVILSPSDGELSPTMRPLVSVSLLGTSVSSSVSEAVVAQSLRVGVGVTK